jgi:hypothetical protein
VLPLDLTLTFRRLRKLPMPDYYPVILRYDDDAAEALAGGSP